MKAFLTSRAALPLVAVAAALLGAGATWLVQRQASGDAIRSYLLEHPEVLPEAMAKLQERNTAKVIAANRSDIVQPVGTAWAGNAKGDVTVVEYLDYNCGYCKASVPIVADLIRGDPGVKVVYREWPVLSQESVTAARYGMVAARMGADYGKLHDAFYANHPLTDAGMEAALKTVGLDPAAVKKGAAMPEVDATIVTNTTVMRQLSQTGTPAWVIGDKVFTGMMTLEDMKKAVAEARKRG